MVFSVHCIDLATVTKHNLRFRIGTCLISHRLKNQQFRKMSKASSAQSLKLSAAGRKFQLGMVYDAYKNKLFEDLILLKKCPDKGKRPSLCPSLSLDLKSSCTIKERIEAFRLSGHVKVGAVFGFFELGSASASYINDQSSSIGQARMTLHYQQTIRYEELDMATIQTLSCNYEMLKTAKERGATHFVAGMTYGNHVIIDFKYAKRHEREHDLFNIKLKGLISYGQSLANKLNKDKTELINEDDIDCKLFCESMPIKQPKSFVEALDIYKNLPTTLQNAEAVDCVYLLPLSIIDKDAKKFKQSHIDDVTMQRLVDIRDDLYEQEMQCAAMEKQGIDTSSRLDAIQKYTDDLKSALSSTNVERWNEEVVKHDSSKFQMQRFHTWKKKKIRALTCSGCQRIFSAESDFAEHMKMREDRTCRTCKKEFCTESGFAQHMSDHEPRACRRCNNKFSTESELAQHMKIHEDRTCHRCNKEFSTQSELAQHMSDKKDYRCPWCGNEFSTENELNQHCRIHIARWCSRCNTEFSTESELEQHQKDVMARICGRCNKEFSTESEFAQHTNDVIALPCSRCNKEFCTDSELAKHMELYHDYTCRNCKKDFFTESELEQHMMFHKARTCGRCYKEFSTESELAQHMEDVEVRPCCKCNKDFCTESELAEHLKSYHGLHTAE